MPALSLPNCGLQLLLLLIVMRLPTGQSIIDVWFGSAPFCRASPSNCHQFDMRFVDTDVYGAGNKCIRGTKVHCQQRPLDVALVATPSSELVVVSYNVFEISFAKTHSGQSERTCHIPRILLNKYPDTDVLVILGLFMGGCLQSGQASKTVGIVDLLQSYGFTQSTPIQGESSRSVFNQNGGIVIASRWPIITTQEMVFTHYTGDDRYSEKGAIWAQVLKHGVPYNVIGTHLQEGDEYANIRLQQAGELQDFIRDLNVPMSQPIIIAGDFNVDRNGEPAQAKALVKEMGAEMPDFIGDVSATVDFSRNDMVDPKRTTKEWLDYIVSSSGHKQPSQATLEACDLKMDKTIKYCASAKLQPYYVAPDARLCGQASSTRDLSDHFPVVGRFLFNT